MIKRINGLLLCGVVLLMMAVGADAQTLYGALGGNQANSSLYRINTTTGQATPIGLIGWSVTGLAFHPVTKVLYGVTAGGGARRALIRIDPVTGAGTFIAPLGADSFNAVPDIAFRADGTLFGWYENGDDLVTINLTTGQLTKVGESGVSTAGSGLAFDAGGTLYFAGNGSSGALRTVNPATGLTTVVTTLSGAPGGQFEVPALDFHPVSNVLYGITMRDSSPFEASLVTINTTTGKITVIGQTTARMDAIAFSFPDPAPGAPVLPLTATRFISTTAPNNPPVFPLTTAEGALSESPAVTGPQALAVFNPNTGIWYIEPGPFPYKTAYSVAWGAPGLNVFTQVPMWGDIDGDNVTDLVVFNQPQGRWYVLQGGSKYTTAFQITWGTPTVPGAAPSQVQTPVIADLDGDGRLDLAVFTNANATWYVLQGGSNFTTAFAVTWGTPGLGNLASPGQVPLVGDFDGDAKTDIAIYSYANATWYVLQAGTKFTTAFSVAWGTPGTGMAEVPIVADLDGDGRHDIVIMNSVTGVWYVLQAGTGYKSAFSVTWAGTEPLVGDWDNDGKTDIAQYIRAQGIWYILQGGTKFTSAFSAPWGTPGGAEYPVSR